MNSINPTVITTIKTIPDCQFCVVLGNSMWESYISDQTSCDVYPTCGRLWSINWAAFSLCGHWFKQTGIFIFSKGFLEIFTKLQWKAFLFLHRTVQLWSVWEIKEVGFNFFFFHPLHPAWFFFFLTLIHASFWANSSQTDICHSILVLKCQPQTHKHCWNAMEKKSFKSQMG